MPRKIPTSDFWTSRWIDGGPIFDSLEEAVRSDLQALIKEPLVLTYDFWTSLPPQNVGGFRVTLLKAFETALETSLNAERYDSHAVAAFPVQTDVGKLDSEDLRTLVHSLLSRRNLYHCKRSVAVDLSWVEQHAPHLLTKRDSK